MGVSLTTFIEGLFDPVPDGSVVCLSYPSGTGTGWTNAAGSTRTYLKLELQEAHEVYVSSALVKKEQEHLRRNREVQTHTRVIVLDDIGTKAQVPPVEPSAILETSKGNYQYIYKLVDGELSTAYGKINAIYSECAKKGYTDAGGLNPARVFRVPGSMNRKRKPPFAAQVTLWEPERNFTVESLASAFGVSLEEVVPMPTIGQQLPKFEGEISDPVLDWMVELNLVAATRRDWLDLICPWSSDHTPGRDDHAGYKPLGRGDMPLLRGFRCHHEHCKDKSASDFLEWVTLSGGPTVDVFGVNEMPLNIFRNSLEAMTEEERIALYRASLPAIHKSQLPDAVFTMKGEPKESQLPTQENLRFVMNELEISPKLNIMSRTVELTFTNLRRKELCLMEENKQCYRTFIDTCMKLGIRGHRPDIDNVIEEFASVSSYHPFETWVLSKPWDNVDRIGALKATVAVTNNCVLPWGVYLRRWLIQTIQAGFGWRDPKQIALVLTMVGRQYLGKTEWFKALAPAEYRQEGLVINLTNQGAKDSIIRATMFPLVEIGEMDATFRVSDVAALKNFLSLSNDVYRAPYGHRAVRWPRATSYFGSVNRKEFLVDETGSRRFLPVEVRSLIYDHDIDMQQLWRQVYEIWRSGEQWWLTSEENNLRAIHALKFEQQEAAIDLLDAWLATHDDTEHEAMNVTQVGQRLRVRMNPKVKGLMSAYLIKRLGKKGTVLGQRNSWKFPTHMKNTLHVQE